MKRIIKTRIKRNESTLVPDVAQTHGGLKGSLSLKNFLDAEPWNPVKYFPGEKKEVFMERCLDTETDKGLSLEKAKTLCELMFDEFVEQEKILGQNESIGASDIATKNVKLRNALDRRVDTQNVSGALILSDALDYLIDLDEIHFSLEQSNELEQLLQDIEVIGEQLNDSHLYNKQSSGSRKAKMRKYYRQNRLRILMKRKKLKRSIKGKTRERAKGVMAKSDRTASGRKKHKNWASKGHLNERWKMEASKDMNWSVFDAAKRLNRRPLFKDFVAPMIERQKKERQLSERIRRSIHV